MNPIDYAGKIETFEQLYEAWAKDYFKKVSPSSVRTVTSTYKYYSAHPEFSDFENEIRKLTFS